MYYRDVFEYMLGQFREKKKSRHLKGEMFTSEQLHAVREEYDEAARLCIFRVESLKQGQSRSLLTQAARHHAAQVFPLLLFPYSFLMTPSLTSFSSFFFLNFHNCYWIFCKQINFFRKGLQSLEAVEPHIRDVAEKQHIDYELCELNDVASFETNDDGELSFDYSLNKKEFENTTTSRNSMEVSFLIDSSLTTLAQRTH